MKTSSFLADEKGVKIFVIVLLLILNGTAFGKPSQIGYARAAEYFRADLQLRKPSRHVRPKKISALEKRAISKDKVRKKVITSHKKRSPASAPMKRIVVESSMKRGPSFHGRYHALLH